MALTAVKGQEKVLCGSHVWLGELRVSSDTLRCEGSEVSRIHFSGLGGGSILLFSPS